MAKFEENSTMDSAVNHLQIGVEENDTTPLKAGKDLELQRKNVEFENADEFSPIQPETSVPKGDENVLRGNWSHKADFLLSLLGYAVGLTNVWRFPYICYRNGGGAFLIPYWIFLLCSGVPLFFLEVGVGQFTSTSAITMWSLCPMLKGVGYATIIVTVIITIYYEVLMSYIIFYFTQSLTLGELPWKNCGNWWNSDNCLDYNNETLRLSYIQYRTWKETGDGDLSLPGAQHAEYFGNKTYRSPAEEYFLNRALQIGGGLDDLGPIVPNVFFCLIPTWIITGMCLVKGVKSAGKAVYFTATFPYVMLTALLIRSITLPGAMEGIKFFIIPDFKRLLEPQVWCDAAFQVFFSLGPGWGGLITMGSYNKFHNNCYRDGVLVPILTGLSSFFAGFVVFSVAGFMATIIGRPVGEVIDEGPQLAFVMYPEVVTKLPLAPLWSLLFFFMLFTLGLDSMFVMIETAITAVWDELPQRFKIKRIFILLISCILMFIAGLPATTKGGMYFFQIVDNYTATYTVILVCIMETFCISWIYGAERFLDDVKFMIGYRPPVILWCFIWRIITCGVLMGIFLVAVVRYAPLKVYEGYTYPEWSKALGWMFTLVSLLWIPGWAIYSLIRSPGSTLSQKLRNSALPTQKWGPALRKHKEDWIAYKKVPPYGESLVSRISHESRILNSVLKQTDKNIHY